MHRSNRIFDPVFFCSPVAARRSCCLFIHPFVHTLSERNRMSCRGIKLFLISAMLGLPAMAFAVAPALGPSPPATQAQIAALQQAVRDAQTSGDNAWVLISATLVLLMTAPGLRGVTDAPIPNYGGTIPEQTFMVYQLMFAIITPALITGAFAERVKFSSMAVFLCLWSLVVYCPMAHID